MPFVRFSRDKRGYEHVYLVEASRGRGAQAHVLYWFRTPPGIKVGREPFDESVRRALEAQNPNLVFDWTQIVSTPKPPPDAEHWRERRKAERAAKKARIDDVDEVEDVKDVQDALPAAAEESVDEVAEARGADAGMASGEQAVAEVAAAPGAPGTLMSDPLAQPGQRRRRRRGGRRRRRGPGVAVPGMPPGTMDPPPAPSGADQDPGPVVSDPGGPGGPGGYDE